MEAGSHARVDVAVLTVIPAELEAAQAALGLDDKSREKDPDGSVYFRGKVPSALTGRDYDVALGCIGGAGNPGAAVAATSMLARYEPRAVLLMGIAAGVRGKVRIGDVVLSERVVAYEPAALVRSAAGSAVQPRPEIDRAPHTMIQDVHAYRADTKRLTEAFVAAGGQIPKPAPGQEVAFREHVATFIAAHLGTIASGEKLLRDPSKLVALRDDMHGKTEAGEMEAAGLVEACRRKNVPWLVLRGISDFGDELKDDRFHAFAARAAATVTVDFIARGLQLSSGKVGVEPATPKPPPPCAMLGPNPFVFGRPIDHDDDFLGRENETARIQEAIRKDQPVQIRAVLSSLAVTTRVPSGENATATTLFVCPSRAPSSRTGMSPWTIPSTTAAGAFAGVVPPKRLMPSTSASILLPGCSATALARRPFASACALFSLCTVFVSSLFCIHAASSASTSPITASHLFRRSRAAFARLSASSVFASAPSSSAQRLSASSA